MSKIGERHWKWLHKWFEEFQIELDGRRVPICFAVSDNKTLGADIIRISLAADRADLAENGIFARRLASLEIRASCLTPAVAAEGVAAMYEVFATGGHNPMDDVKW